MATKATGTSLIDQFRHGEDLCVCAGLHGGQAVSGSKCNSQLMVSSLLLADS
ncbi:hypothetical protein PS655_05799 [Pseudomonas fluorescens]|uniref:Uncharacterized protein n=1 Tax=Pseudomonas fluorescens TaxID=294 RepID=A0A5E6XY20_PSEFL|nr:hypothetical protein PS655_05799 [Pseudomonas fluorescens]